MDYLITFLANKTSPFYSQLIPSYWTPDHWARHFLYKYWTLTMLDYHLLSYQHWWWTTYNSVTSTLCSFV